MGDGNNRDTLMERQPVQLVDFKPRIFQLLDDQWMLLASGDFKQKQFNAMTVSWGSMGTIWNKPFVQVLVRPGRYTAEFMNRYETFTLSAFPDECRDALMLLGTVSGRESDKIRDSGLTPIASQRVEAPSFLQSELVLECRKMFWQDLDSTNFIDAGIEGHYPEKDYHRMFFGEVLGIYAASSVGG